MATAKSRTQYSICNKQKNTYNCCGCSKDFCSQHLTEHRQLLAEQLDEIIDDHDQFQQTIIQQKQNPIDSSLIEQINEWETNSIKKVQKIAQECRDALMKWTQKSINNVEKKFIDLFQKLKEIREENEFNEIDLKHFQLKLTQITQELFQPVNISIHHDPQEIIKKISIISLSKRVRFKLNKWSQRGIIIAGSNQQGDQLNQLSAPEGIFIDNHNNICIADCDNHRIVEWKCHSNEGQIIAGNNGRGNRNDQLSYPINVIVDKENNSLIISDYKNKRVIRLFRRNPTKQQILISHIYCWSVAMDKHGFIYVSDWKKNEVRRWKEGDERGTIVAGTVVAGGNGKGDSLKQLSYPCGVTVDHLGKIYVVDNENHRVMCWCKGDAEGKIIVGGNGEGKKSNQLSYPTGLSFDEEENLYVVDWGNNRVLKHEKIC
ncbi:unnamed protein product [Adineta steineri]|uniref:Uncharacterized protein n=1 Tax=Adineta steineri TaxID=433720 RepID=A0A819M5S8_9BILA|nr:unnamed protein product [Adineta steineri]